jgi:hypothetical protein
MLDPTQSLDPTLWHPSWAHCWCSTVVLVVTELLLLASWLVLPTPVVLPLWLWLAVLLPVLLVWLLRALGVAPLRSGLPLTSSPVC